MRTAHTRHTQEDQQSSAGVSQAPTTAPSTTTTTIQQTRTTKNTRLNGDEPDQFPENFVFSGSEEEEWEIDYFGRILAVRLSLDMSDSLMLWWYDFSDSVNLGNHVRIPQAQYAV